jgi:hypothetical protein
MPTLAQIQIIANSTSDPNLQNAIALFRTKQNSPQELSLLGAAYATLASAFENVRTLVGETDDVDYGDTTPEALYEYIVDRAVTAAASINDAEIAANFINPNKGSQAKALRWYGASGSGI